MQKTANGGRFSSWVLIAVRTLLVTFLISLLWFAVSLLLGILGLALLGLVRGVHPDMRLAYRQIAVPSALVACAMVLLLSFVMEVRHYRRRKMLASDERNH